MKDKQFDKVIGLIGELGELSVFIMVSSFVEILIFSIYIFRQNYLKDIIWALPIMFIFMITTLLLLDRYLLCKEVMMIKIKYLFDGLGVKQ